MKEYEFKFLQDKDAFITAQQIIKEYYPESISKEVFQTNYYYDNDDFDLKKKGVTVRIRQNDQTLRLQIKKHLKLDKEYSCSDEKEKEVKTLYNSIVIDDKSYILQGSLSTKRISYIIQEGLSVEFDTNTYLGCMDYEIEIEFIEEMHQEALKIIELLKLQLNPKDKGKVTRFIKKKKEIIKNEYINQ